MFRAISLQLWNPKVISSCAAFCRCLVPTSVFWLLPCVFQPSHDASLPSPIVNILVYNAHASPCFARALVPDRDSPVGHAGARFEVADRYRAVGRPAHRVSLRFRSLCDISNRRHHHRRDRRRLRHCPLHRHSRPQPPASRAVARLRAHPNRLNCVYWRVC